VFVDKGVRAMIHSDLHNPKHILIILLQLLNENRITQQQYDVMEVAVHEDALQELEEVGRISPEERVIIREAEAKRRESSTRERTKI